MSKYIEKNSLIKRNSLDERSYFNSLINEAYKLNIISVDDIFNIQLKCFDLLKYNVQKYNGYNSSSILTDKAKVIMDSNLYTISLYLKEFVPDEAINIINNEDIIEIYTKGRKIIDRKIKIARVIYHKVLNNTINIKNDIYNNTINLGIKAFFKIYNSDFDACNIKITADYPLYNNLINRIEGIEFIEQYLRGIYYENEFCNLFEKEKIDNLLYRYSKKYKDLIINIFQIILVNVIGIKIANEDIKNLKISKIGLNNVYDKMYGKTKEEIYDLIFETYNKIRKELFESNFQLQEYIEEGFFNIQAEIYNNYVIRKLDKIFL